MADQVCGDLVKLAEEVHEISLVVERLKVVDQGHDKMLEGHQAWLTNHQQLMERMAVSEIDRKSLHEALVALQTRLDTTLGTVRWAVGTLIAIIALTSPILFRMVEHLYGGK